MKNVIFATEFELGPQISFSHYGANIFLIQVVVSELLQQKY